MSLIPHQDVRSAESIMNLVLKTNGGGIYPDYGLYVAQYLRDLGIEVEVKIEEWSVFVGTLCGPSSFDLAIRTFDFSLLDPDPTKYFSSDSDQNYASIHYGIPYVNESDEIISQTCSLTNQSQRISSYIEWSNLVLDKIVSVFPLFNERRSVLLWPNIQNYQTYWKLVDNLPYLNFDGFHSNQTSLNELNLASHNWRGLNPLLSIDSESDLMIDFIFEPLIQVDPISQLPLNTGLIDNWEMINNSYYIFHVRDEIFWNPSFNVLSRNVNSQPLNFSDQSSLMDGLQGDFSNGTNKQLTAKDVVFTLLSFSNPLVSKHSAEYSWIRDFELNQTDDLSFSLVVDGNPNTIELEHYAPIWSKLNVPCIPEFFLNSTNLDVTESSGNIPMVGIYEGIVDTLEWRNYRDSGFGCGKYLLDYFELSGKTVFRSNPNWFNVGAIDGSTQFLNISTINVRTINEDSIRKKEFQAGKLDYFEPTIPFDLPFDTFFQVHSCLSDKVSCLFFDVNRPGIGGDDNYINSTKEGKEDYSKAATVRKAICYAIDRNKINEERNRRWYTLQHGLINELFSHPFLENIFDYEYNLDTAIEWLTGVRPATPTPTETPSNPITTISFGFGFLYGISVCSVLVLLNKKKRKIIKK